MNKLADVERICLAALEHPVSERAAFVVEACQGDEALRHEVESLLAHASPAERFLAQPALHADDALAGLSGLSIGQNLGAYQIIARLGAGGMGEVYRGRDTRLGRDVAIKILPVVFAADPERLARFEREARLLASLNHPHIAAIYGIETGPEETGHQVRALVMELVEGVALSDRIARGPVPVTEALAIAQQIADALAAAHEQGIIHRDLKPANIRLRADGTVKVLDFGLAKTLPASSAQADSASASPTAHTMTEAGLILGTAAYMSPEQARGELVDQRTDVWAFGCVLYEILTGRVAFGGRTATDTLAKVLEGHVDVDALPAATPPAIRRLIRRCLERSVRNRLQHIGDAQADIADVRAGDPLLTIAPASAGPSSHGGAWAVGAVALALLAATGVWFSPRRSLADTGAAAVVRLWGVTPSYLEQRVVPARFAVVPAATQPLNVSRFDRDLAISPDGRHLVYRYGGSPNVGAPLMLREIDQLDVRPIEGIYALGIFFSPDSKWLGFFSNSEVQTDIQKVSISGGPAIRLGAVNGTSLGASWGDDNTIVFATDDPASGLWRVSADGGSPTVLTTPDAARGESDHAFPSVLPGGRGVLFTVMDARRTNDAQIAVLDLQTGARKTLIRGGSQAEYVQPSPGSGQPGYLLYAAAAALHAVAFDLATLAVVGQSVTLVDRLLVKANGAANFATSLQGTLFYMPGGVSVQTAPRSLLWVDRNGHEETINAPTRPYGGARLSPDNSEIVVGIASPDGDADLWIWDFARQFLRRLTFSPGYDGLPLWTPDGRRILFTSDRAGVVNLYSQAADGSGTVDRLTTTANPQYPTSITSDGTRLVGFETVAGVPRLVLFHVTAMRPEPAHARFAGAVPVGLEPSGEKLFEGSWPEFSPDGQYLAYQSDRSTGRSEIYVRPYPNVDSGSWQVSFGGGTRAVWARSGRELFYLDASNTLIAVPVHAANGKFSAGMPRRVFDAKYSSPFPPRVYDVSRDGSRFLMLKDETNGDPAVTSPSLVVVNHWFDELKQRMTPRGR